MSWNPIKAVKKLHNAMPGVGSADPRKALANFHNAQPGRGGSMDLIGKVDSRGNIIGEQAYGPYADIDQTMTYQQPFGYQLAQMPQLPQTQGTDYNSMFAQMIRQMQMQPQQMPQPRSGGAGNYLFGQSFIPQPQQQYQQQMPQFDYTRAMMGRRF